MSSKTARTILDEGSAGMKGRIAVCCRYINFDGQARAVYASKRTPNQIWERNCVPQRGCGRTACNTCGSDVPWIEEADPFVGSWICACQCSGSCRNSRVPALHTVSHTPQVKLPNPTQRSLMTLWRKTRSSDGRGGAMHTTALDRYDHRITDTRARQGPRGCAPAHVPSRTVARGTQGGGKRASRALTHVSAPSGEASLRV